jgi:hypothetical protein
MVKPHEGVGLRRLRHYAIQTGKEMAREMAPASAGPSETRTSRRAIQGQRRKRTGVEDEE